MARLSATSQASLRYQLTITRQLHVTAVSDRCLVAAFLLLPIQWFASHSRSYSVLYHYFFGRASRTDESRKLDSVPMLQSSAVVTIPEHQGLNLARVSSHRVCVGQYYCIYSLDFDITVYNGELQRCSAHSLLIISITLHTQLCNKARTVCNLLVEVTVTRNFEVPVDGPI